MLSNEDTHDRHHHNPPINVNLNANPVLQKEEDFIPSLPSKLLDLPLCVRFQLFVSVCMTHFSGYHILSELVFCGMGSLTPWPTPHLYPYLGLAVTLEELREEISLYELKQFWGIMVPVKSIVRPDSIECNAIADLFSSFSQAFWGFMYALQAKFVFLHLHIQLLWCLYIYISIQSLHLISYTQFWCSFFGIEVCDSC